MVKRRKLWGTTFALMFFSAGVVQAHTEGEGHDGVDELILDCDHLPKNVATALPEPVRQFAQIECVPAGQKLVAAKGWVWRYPGSWTVRPEAPAWAPEASMTEPGRKYFTAFEAIALSGAVLADTHRQLRRDSPVYASSFENEPSAIYRLRATNSQGQWMDIFFPRENADRYWAILCVPQCRPEYAFLMERMSR